MPPGWSTGSHTRALSQRRLWTARATVPRARPILTSLAKGVGEPAAIERQPTEGRSQAPRRPATIVAGCSAQTASETPGQPLHDVTNRLLHGRRENPPDKRLHAPAASPPDPSIQEPQLFGREAPSGRPTVLNYVRRGIALGDRHDAVLAQAPIDHHLRHRPSRHARDVGDGAVRVAVEHTLKGAAERTVGDDREPVCLAIFQQAGL